MKGEGCKAKARLWKGWGKLPFCSARKYTQNDFLGKQRRKLKDGGAVTRHTKIHKPRRGRTKQDGKAGE